MRATSRLLAAAARPAARYLEPGTPTGLTGLATHSSPRATLLYLYTATLEKLRRGVPEHSVYRQSVEALTRQRLALVEATVPPGYDEWAARARRLLREHPEQFSVEAAATRAATGVSARGSPATVRVDVDDDGDGSGGRTFVVARLPEDVDVRYLEWDGEVDEGPEPEGSRTLEERDGMRKIFQRRDIADQDAVEWEPEPPLTADQCVFFFFFPLPSGVAMNHGGSFRRARRDRWDADFF